MVYEQEKHTQPNFFMKLILKFLVKNTVVGAKPYSKNGQTAPQFLITNERDFEKEKQRLIDFIKRAEKDGKAFFDGKESMSFGALTAQEWSTMFYKHLDHHLTQFGV
jgi:hypothetical protein